MTGNTQLQVCNHYINFC